MGEALSWIAVQGATAKSVQTALGVVETGEHGWDYYDFPMAGFALAKGWYLVMARGDRHPILGNGVLAKLSPGTTVVGCSIEEHMMYMSAVCWRDGAMVWRVSHRGSDHGVMDLVVEGTPPESFAELRRRFFAEQDSEGGTAAGVDVIAEIPLELARSIVGFKHDEADPETGLADFNALRPAPR